MWIKVDPVIDMRVIALCRRPYPNHPKGCPNWEKKKGCPPDTKSLHRQLHGKDVYAIYNKFDFAAHVERMRKKHPDWSKRQLECCLYWQQTARKQLREEIKKFKEQFPEYKIIRTPEACGVNVTATM